MQMATKYWKPWVESLYEIGFTLLYSFAFIFVATLVYVLSHGGVEAKDAYFYVLEKNIKPTETFSYLLGFLAPAMWIMFKYVDRWKHAWVFRALMIMQGVASLSATVIYILAFLGKIEDKELADLLSWICIGLSLLVWYFTLVYYKAVLESAADKIHQPTPDSESGSDVLASLRGGK